MFRAVGGRTVDNPAQCQVHNCSAYFAWSYSHFLNEYKAGLCFFFWLAASKLISFRMTDDSNIVLRWEIDNAQAKFATGRVESKVFDQGGFKW